MNICTAIQPIYNWINFKWISKNVSTTQIYEVKMIMVFDHIVCSFIFIIINKYNKIRNFMNNDYWFLYLYLNMYGIILCVFKTKTIVMFYFCCILISMSDEENWEHDIWQIIDSIYGIKNSFIYFGDIFSIVLLSLTFTYTLIDNQTLYCIAFIIRN